MKSLEIAGRRIGPGFAPYVVAELSANHAGSLERALAIMEAAKAAGADAVKLQTYTADTITIDHDGPDFRIKGGLWGGRRLYELYDEAHTPWGWHRALFDKGAELGLTVFSSPFDATAVDFLEELAVPAYKVASFELIDIPLIKYIAATGKPTIISTGMGSVAEIAEAVEAFHAAGGSDLILLHCVSGYPTPVEQANLRRIPVLSGYFECPVGLSDHTLGVDVAITSVALGACLIEKHVTLARADGGPDAAFSIEPQELAALVRSSARAFAALGDGSEPRAASEQASFAFRRSLYVVRDMAQGEVFSADNVRSIRPGFGLPPKTLPTVIGRRAKQPISRGTRLSWDIVS